MRRTLQLAGVGTLAGLFSGLFGVGGGILFVPAPAIFAGLSQLEAEATSLLATGNLQLRAGLLVGALAIAVPERGLEHGFAALLLFTAYQVTREELEEEEDG